MASEQKNTMNNDTEKERQEILATVQSADLGQPRSSLIIPSPIKINSKSSTTLAMTIQEIRLQLLNKSVLTKSISDGELLRFCIARSFDMAKAVELYVGYVEWKKQIQPDNIPNDKIATSLKNNAGFVYGNDKMGRPTIYIRARYHSNKVPTEESQLYAIKVVMEALSLLSEPTFNPSQTVSQFFTQLQASELPTLPESGEITKLEEPSTFPIIITSPDSSMPTPTPSESSSASERSEDANQKESKDDSAQKVAPKQVVSQFSAIFDFAGFGRSNFDVAILKSILNFLDRSFPERLGKLYIINTGWLFWVLWKIVTPFIPKRTKQKIQIYTGNARTELTAAWDSQLLLTEYGGTAISEKSSTSTSTALTSTALTSSSIAN